jgi:hypothetical protein
MQANTNITVYYDLSRAKCDHMWVDGVDTWRVEMGHAINQVIQPMEPIGWIEPTGYPQMYRTPIIPHVPEGKIEIWFICSNAAEVVHDSNYGSNFEFHIGKVPQILFKSDYTQIVQNGPIVQDGSVWIEYSMSRAKCLPTDLSIPWELLMYYTLHTPFGIVTEHQSLDVSHSNDTPRVFTAMIRNLPKSDLILWFVCRSNNETLVDSNVEQNYVFPIQ